MKSSIYRISRSIIRYLIAVGAVQFILGLLIGFHIKKIAKAAGGLDIILQMIGQASTFLSIVAVLIGGVGAVFVSQILQTYRSDIEAARQFRSRLKVIQSQFESSQVRGWSSAHTQEVIRDIERIYTNNYWLLPTSQQEEMAELLGKLHEQHDHLQRREQREDPVDFPVSLVQGLPELCCSLDKKIAYVTVLKAALRYFGWERPYPNYEDRAQNKADQ